MLIQGNIRPRGLKPGVRTETFYKAIGLKDAPDLRDVVGTLTVSATRLDDLAFLAALHRALGGLYGAGKVVIYDDKGKKVYTRTKSKEFADVSR